MRNIMVLTMIIMLMLVMEQGKIVMMYMSGGKRPRKEEVGGMKCLDRKKRRK